MFTERSVIADIQGERKEAAVDVVSSQAHFSTMFNRETGFTPAKRRRGSPKFL